MPSKSPSKKNKEAPFDFVDTRKRMRMAPTVDPAGAPPDLTASQVNDTDTSVNHAAWLFGVDDLRVLPFELKPPGAGEVKVDVGAVGICGSDVHYWKHMAIGDFVVEKPMVIGHESAGVVSAVGERVEGLQVGDRVAMEPGVPCKCCSQVGAQPLVVREYRHRPRGRS